MKKYLLFLTLGIIISCQRTVQEKAVLYQSDAFTIYKDKVVQGDNIAEVLSPTHIKSNYKSPASATFSRLISFKFSINEKDNELSLGNNHWLIIGDEHESPLIKFGEQPLAQPETPNMFLPINYEYTFRVDMSSVLNQFEGKGYYETYDGSKIARSDFKAFYIAGGLEPLTWDFVNLDKNGLMLKPTDQPNIYQITIQLNPYNEANYQDKEWQLSLDVSKRPQYKSNQPIVDALYNLSLEEATKNIEVDSTFRTGAKWGGVWTRDVSYSIFLAFAYHEPEVAKISLRKKVKRGRIIQDTGSGGAWPVSSDRTTWALAAWEIYKTTGDVAWLNEIYPIIKNSLEDDYKTVYDSQTSLYSGESSFLDWREQTYPKWMSNMDIYVSENLGTNVVHYQAHKILAEMAKLKGVPYEIYNVRAEKIKEGINNQLWLNDQGYYAQYLYGRPNLTVSPRFEALGEALSVLFNVADETKARSIISKSPITDYGVTCIYPQIPGIPPYHNNGIWPFVQSYWNLAAAKVGNEQVLNQGLASIYSAGALFLSNYENFVAKNGDYLGTEINSDRMLWSMAGNISMVHRVFMGMSFKTDGLYFNPVVPKGYDGTKTLSNFKYRNTVLDITVNGFGNEIKQVLIDGNPVASAFILADLTGKHNIEIELNNLSFNKKEINIVPNRFSLPTPQVTKEGNALKWQTINGAKSYNIYKNGNLVKATTETEYLVSEETFTEYKISALDDYGYESFTSEPIMFTKSVKIFEIEDFTPAAKLPFTNFSGKGFVEVSTTKNKIILLAVSVEKAGDYLVDVRYSNGSGPWNTDNKCAIRSLLVNGDDVGVLVMPQRGKDEWSDWGFSNGRKIQLRAGSNVLKITFEDWNNNMNVDMNTAMLDYLRIIAINN